LISAKMASKRKAEEDTTSDGNKKFAKSIKKALGKVADGSMTVKDLQKSLGNSESKDDFKSSLKAAAQKYGGFEVNGKTVSLNTEKKDTTSNVSEEKKEKKEKKAKKSKTTVTTVGGDDEDGPAIEAQNQVPEKDKKAIQDWRDSNLVQASEDILPILTFQDERLPKNVIKASCSNFIKPTAIQSQCWPVLLSGRDMIGLAETGSGKTLAFTLPGLKDILFKWNNKQPKWQQPMVLVLAPTRELALQSCKVAEDAAKGVGVTLACIYGGVSRSDQVNQLRKGVAMVIATPGRLQDLVEDNCCDLSQVGYVVLDEADRMLDMGFLPSIRAILGACQPLESRQTSMLSATWPQAIQKLAGEFLKHPIKVTVGSAHNEATANIRITQVVEVVEERERDAKLLQLLAKHHKTRKNRVLVFGLYKKECARMETMLNRAGWSCGSVHGDKGQHEREAAVNAFKAGTAPLLIATDVAARGLDIPDVEVVINYSFPLTIEDYVHRIGRTGRAGKTGIAHTFFHQGDKAHAGELVNVLQNADQPVPSDLTKFGIHTKKKLIKILVHFLKMWI